MKRTKIRVVGDSTVADQKVEIQALAREIVILRDDGCIFKNERGHVCSGYGSKSGQLVLQADHLLPRSNSGTFADTRLIVCVCKGIHGWKSIGSNLRKEEYDRRVKKLLPKDRVELWERCEADRYKGHTRMTSHDWKLEILNLKSELADLKKTQI